MGHLLSNYQKLAMGLPQSLCKSLITTEWRLPGQHTNQFLHYVVVESPQTAHFMMGVTKPVNFAQGIARLQKYRGNEKNSRIRLLTSAEGGRRNGSSEYQSSSEQENLT